MNFSFLIKKKKKR